MSQHVLKEVFQVEREAQAIIDTAQKEAELTVQELKSSLERQMQEYTLLLRKQREQEVERILQQEKDDLAAYREEIAARRPHPQEIARRSQRIVKSMSEILLSSRLTQRDR
ncbi:MAG: hypothetical protein JXK93_07385 [Sphaerochaetaceae bacterium]|nr:hypothetical protein [Sphaerochaetaceae bacterium]